MSKPANVICDPVTGVCRYIPDEETPSTEAPAAATDSPLYTLLGPTLKSKTGPVPVSTIAGPSKVVGLYFSAHWCGPCRNFTPVLAKFYTQFKESHARSKDLEIVFVSSDRDEASFASYYADMPWLALPFEDRTRKAELSKKFQVQGIPTLVLLDAGTGGLITRAGREKVSSDPAAEDFPWKPRSLPEIIAGDLVNAAGATTSSKEALAGKVILLYFSAHWCPPCRGFTPVLVESYKRLKAAGKNVEVVFVSGDRSEDQFKEYLAEMPWLALPFDKKKARAELDELFEVEGIPTLVVLEEDGKVINMKGRAAVAADPQGVEFPWRPKPLQELNGDNVSDVNDEAVLLLVGPGDIKLRATALLQTLAEEHKASDKAGDLSFAYGSTDDEVIQRVLSFAGVTTAAERDTLLILNVPEQCKYVFDGPEVTQPVVADLVARFLRGSLAVQPLGH